jgi:hypothetical protein
LSSYHCAEVGFRDWSIDDASDEPDWASSRIPRKGWFDDSTNDG